MKNGKDGKNWDKDYDESWDKGGEKYDWWGEKWSHASIVEKGSSKEQRKGSSKDE